MREEIPLEEGASFRESEAHLNLGFDAFGKKLRSSPGGHGVNVTPRHEIGSVEINLDEVGEGEGRGMRGLRGEIADGEAITQPFEVETGVDKFGIDLGGNLENGVL